MTPSHLIREHLILFARPPCSGKVKTRLIPVLGDHGAAALYQAFLKDTAAMAYSVRKARPTVGLTAEWAPRDIPLSHLDLASWMPGPFLHQEQHGTDLGHRMAAALGRRLVEGGRGVLLGTDFPDLSPKIPITAFEALEEMGRDSSNDRSLNAVIGPSSDGGYYLIGLSRPIPGAFIDIEWGTAHVLDQTLERLKTLSVSVQLLPEWHDVDTPADFRALQSRLLCPAEDVASQTRKALKLLGIS